MEGKEARQKLLEIFGNNLKFNKDFDRNIMRLKGTMIADLFEWCKGCRDNKELGSVPKKKEFKNLYVFSGK